jgi:hypothetical protein
MVAVRVATSAVKGSSMNASIGSGCLEAIRDKKLSLPTDDC